MVSYVKFQDFVDQLVAGEAAAIAKADAAAVRLIMAGLEAEINAAARALRRRREEDEFMLTMWAQH